MQLAVEHEMLLTAFTVQWITESHPALQGNENLKRKSPWMGLDTPIPPTVSGSLITGLIVPVMIPATVVSLVHPGQNLLVN